MSEVYTPTNGPGSICSRRGSIRVSTILALLSIVLVSGELFAAPPIRVAVAPFEGGREARDVSKVLAAQMARRNVDRVIAPGHFIARDSFDPRAADVRRWAYSSAVDTIVVGRVVSLRGAGEGNARLVETVIRSGHSGVELGRHEILLPADADLDQSVGVLAMSILVGLGYEEKSDKGRIVNEPARVESADGKIVGPGGGSDADLLRSGFRKDAPIEIKADEAEIISREEGRRLIFQGDVTVRQDNVSLRSDRLEAEYRKGEPEPRQLLANGRVSIDQGNRHAKCDRAIYQREKQWLICRGHAELTQGCDIVRGESIEFDLAGDRARVEGAASIVIQPGGDAASPCPKAPDSL